MCKTGTLILIYSVNKVQGASGIKSHTNLSTNTNLWRAPTPLGLSALSVTANDASWIREKRTQMRFDEDSHPAL